MNPQPLSHPSLEVSAGEATSHAPLGQPSQDPRPEAQIHLTPAEQQEEQKSALVGGGMVAGTAAGAALGTAVGGPVGTLVGALAGAVAGAVGTQAATDVMDA